MKVKKINVTNLKLYTADSDLCDQLDELLRRRLDAAATPKLCSTSLGLKNVAPT